MSDFSGSLILAVVALSVAYMIFKPRKWAIVLGLIVVALALASGLLGGGA